MKEMDIVDFALFTRMLSILIEENLLDTDTATQIVHKIATKNKLQPIYLW